MTNWDPSGRRELLSCWSLTRSPVRVRESVEWTRAGRNAGKALFGPHATGRIMGKIMIKRAGHSELKSPNYLTGLFFSYLVARVCYPVPLIFFCWACLSDEGIKSWTS